MARSTGWCRSSGATEPGTCGRSPRTPRPPTHPARRAGAAHAARRMGMARCGGGAPSIVVMALLCAGRAGCAPAACSQGACNPDERRQGAQPPRAPSGRARPGPTPGWRGYAAFPGGGSAAVPALRGRCGDASGAVSGLRAWGCDGRRGFRTRSGHPAALARGAGTAEACSGLCDPRVIGPSGQAMRALPVRVTGPRRRRACRAGPAGAATGRPAAGRGRTGVLSSAQPARCARAAVSVANAVARHLSRVRRSMSVAPRSQPQKPPWRPP